jgi:acyl-CoA synthetase (AMP-forming)/AMP-acid ligase II
VLRATQTFVAPQAKMHTPYGATECLPVATIEAEEVLAETSAKTDAGAGSCVGRKFDTIEWKVIRITDEAVVSIDEVDELPPGEIGELIVRGPQVSPAYVTHIESNPLGKIAATRDKDFRSPGLPVSMSPGLSTLWHRVGDVGYLDAAGRFWYCGRKSQRVETVDGLLFTECVEAIFNAHPSVSRSALVGVGRRGAQTPVIVIERSSLPTGESENWERDLLKHAAVHATTPAIRNLLVHPSLPVDVRHNAKINREQLTAWAAKQLSQPKTLATSS